MPLPGRYGPPPVPPPEPGPIPAPSPSPSPVPAPIRRRRRCPFRGCPPRTYRSAAPADPAHRRQSSRLAQRPAAPVPAVGRGAEVQPVRELAPEAVSAWARSSGPAQTAGSAPGCACGWCPRVPHGAAVPAVSVRRLHRRHRDLESPGTPARWCRAVWAAAGRACPCPSAARSPRASGRAPAPTRRTARQPRAGPLQRAGTIRAPRSSGGCRSGCCARPRRRGRRRRIVRQSSARTPMPGAHGCRPRPRRPRARFRRR